MVTKHDNNLFSVEVPGGPSILTGDQGMKDLHNAIIEKSKTYKPTGMRIDIEPISLKYQEITDSREFFIEIDKDVFRWRTSFSTKEPKDKEDPMLGYIEQDYEWDVYVKKSSVVAVEIDLGTPEDFDRHWCVEMAVSGRSADIKLYFKERDKATAMKVFEQLRDWTFS